MDSTKKLKISEIKRDLGTQYRADGAGDEASKDFTEEVNLVKSGHEFDPVTVVWDGVQHILADGFRRLRVYEVAEVEELSAKVVVGTLLDAKIIATQANTKHGRKLTQADKRNLIKSILDDKELQEKIGSSDSAIAQHCRVDPKTVAAVRLELGIDKPETVTDKNGRSMATGKIGSKKEIPEAWKGWISENGFVTIDGHRIFGTIKKLKDVWKLTVRGDADTVSSSGDYESVFEKSDEKTMFKFETPLLWIESVAKSVYESHQHKLAVQQQTITAGFSPGVKVRITGLPTVHHLNHERECIDSKWIDTVAEVVEVNLNGVRVQVENRTRADYAVTSLVLLPTLPEVFTVEPIVEVEPNEAQSIPTLGTANTSADIDAIIDAVGGEGLARQFVAASDIVQAIVAKIYPGISGIVSHHLGESQFNRVADVAGLMDNPTRDAQRVKELEEENSRLMAIVDKREDEIIQPLYSQIDRLKRQNESLQSQVEFLKNNANAVHIEKAQLEEELMKFRAVTVFEELSKSTPEDSQVDNAEPETVAVPLDEDNKHFDSAMEMVQLYLASLATDKKRSGVVDNPKETDIRNVMKKFTVPQRQEMRIWIVMALQKLKEEKEQAVT